MNNHHNLKYPQLAKDLRHTAHKSSPSEGLLSKFHMRNNGGKSNHS